MAKPIVEITDSFKILKDKINEISTNVGDPSVLDTTVKVDIVSAVNELETVVRGSATNYDLWTTADNLRDAVNEFYTELYDSGISFTGLSAINFYDGIEELRTELGDHTGLGTTNKTSAVAAINELESAVRGNLTNYTLTTGAGNLIAAVNEHETDLYTSTTFSILKLKWILGVK